MISPITVSEKSISSSWRVPYYVKGLALGIPTYLVAVHLWTWILIVPGSLAKSGYDFRQIYAAAYMVRTGQAYELYDYTAQIAFQDKLVSRTGVALPYVSPAYEALLLSPLSLFSFRTAYFVFLAGNLIALGICFILLKPWMSNLHAVLWWLPVAIFLGFLPIAAALIEEHDSILLTLSLVGSFVLLANGQDIFAGLVVGAAFFKFPIVLPIALLFLIWRRRSFLAGFAISSSVLTLISVWVTGLPQTKLYVDSLFSIAGFKPVMSGLALYPVNWRMMANIHGLTVGVAGNWIHASLLHAITILLSTTTLAWTAFKGLRVNHGSKLLLMAIPCSVLVGHHTYIHDLSVLLLPMVVLLNAFLPAEDCGTSKDRFIGRSAALMFVAPIIESYSPGQFYFVTPVVFLLLVASTMAASAPGFPFAPQSS